MNEAKYLHHKGKYWRNSGLKDCKGWLLLYSLMDDSAGITADPSKCFVADREQSEACEKMRRDIK